MDKTINVLVATLMFSILIAMFGVGFLVGTLNKLENRGLIYNENKMIDNNLSTSDIALILYGDVSSFYNYNMSNKESTLDITQLKTQGGVCRHYAQYYVDRAEEYGLLGQTVSFWGNKSYGHMIALIYDDKLEEYCILDQTTYPRCVQLGGASIGT